MLRASVVASVFVSLVCPSVAEAAGRVWKVGPGAPFRTIQPAVDAATDGDVVLVRPGTYAGFCPPELFNVSNGYRVAW